MNLLGQAYFSKLLIEKFNPRSLKGIAICEKYDNVIGELAKKHGIEVVVLKTMNMRKNLMIQSISIKINRFTSCKLKF